VIGTLSFESKKIRLFLPTDITCGTMQHRTFNIIVEQGSDGYLISTVIELPGCHTQAKSYDELTTRTKEAIELYLEDKKRYRNTNRFVSLQQISV
jgi:predicted RNase H-like HicB family nuclease